MTKRKKKLLITFIVSIIVILTAIFSFNPVIEWLGERELREIAKHYNVCKTDTCYEGMLSTGLNLSEKTGVEPELIPWCLASNLIDNTNFYILNVPKTKFSEWMLSYCGNREMTIDDVNMSITNNDDDH